MSLPLPPPRLYRPVVGLAMLIGIFWWVGDRYRETVALEEWKRIRATGNPAIMEATTPPNEEARVAKAVVLGERLFPPDREAALGELALALEAAPFRSHTWFHVARNLLFTGQPELARIAMERSDILDPWFPGQRLRAIQFWSLLGEDDRAVRLAMSLAAMGPRHQQDAARELVAMGLSPRRTWELLVDFQTTPEEAGRILLAMGRVAPSELSGLAADIEERFLRDSNFQQQLFQRASNPFLYDVLLPTWERNHGPLESASMLPLENGNLALPPYRAGLPIGWYRETGREGILLSWVAPDLADRPDGGGALRFNLEAGSEGFRSRVYRTIMQPVDAESFTLALKVRKVSGPDANAWTTLSDGQSNIRSKPSRLDDSWVEITVDPDPAIPGFVYLTLDIRPVGGRSFPAAALFEIGSIHVHPIGEGQP